MELCRAVSSADVAGPPASSAMLSPRLPGTALSPGLVLAPKSQGVAVAHGGWGGSVVAPEGVLGVLPHPVPPSSLLFSSTTSSGEPRQLPKSCWVSRGTPRPHVPRVMVAVPAALGTGQGFPASLPQLPRLLLPRFAACWHLLIKCKYAVGI